MDIDNETMRYALNKLIDPDAIEKEYKLKYGDKWEEKANEALGQPLDMVELLLVRAMMMKFLQETGKAMKFRDEIDTRMSGMPDELKKMFNSVLFNEKPKEEDNKK